tara:strand:+ start:155 stop:358 length:204 start_codon:yes stop_codon:yes gene_type:complete
VTLEEPPQSPDADTDAAIGKTGLDLGERDVAWLLQQRHDVLALTSVFDERCSPLGFLATARPCLRAS